MSILSSQFQFDYYTKLVKQLYYNIVIEMLHILSENLYLFSTDTGSSLYQKTERPKSMTDTGKMERCMV